MADKRKVVSPTTWKKIKKGYMNGESFRSLGRRYGLNYNSISHRARAEGWQDERNQLISETKSKIIEKTSELISDRESRIAENCFKALDIAVAKIMEGLANCDVNDSRSIRQYMASLSDARDMGAFRSDMDKAEQMARIKKLEKDIAETDKERTFTITIEGGDEYAD